MFPVKIANCIKHTYQGFHFYKSQDFSIRKCQLFRGSPLVKLRVPKISLRKLLIDIKFLLKISSRAWCRERVCSRASWWASSLARQKFEAAELALARSQKFLPICCTLPDTQSEFMHFAFDQLIFLWFSTPLWPKLGHLIDHYWVHFARQG